MKKEFQESLNILYTINSTNSLVIDLVADLKLCFTSKINLVNVEIRYFFRNHYIFFLLFSFNKNVSAPLTTV